MAKILDSFLEGPKRGRPPLAPLVRGFRIVGQGDRETPDGSVVQAVDYRLNYQERADGSTRVLLTLEDDYNPDLGNELHRAIVYLRGVLQRAATEPKPSRRPWWHASTRTATTWQTPSCRTCSRASGASDKPAARLASARVAPLPHKRKEHRRDYHSQAAP